MIYGENYMPVGDYISELTIETLEGGMKYVQS